MISDSARKRHFRALSVELSASRKLGRKLQQMLWRDLNEITPNGFEFAVSYVLFLRAERTLASIRTLARMRMVDDAFALVRVLVEKVINGEYLLLAGIEPAQDFIQYHAFREWRDFEDLRKISPELTPKYSPEQLSELQKAHDDAMMRTLPDGKQTKRYGRGHDWTELGLSKRAEFIDDTLKEQFLLNKQTAARVLYLTAYKKGAVYLHGMWGSIARSLIDAIPSDELGRDGYCNVSVGIRIKDRNPLIAAQAMNTANLAAFELILFLDRLLLSKRNVLWITRFKDDYVLALKKARTLTD